MSNRGDRGMKRGGYRGGYSDYGHRGGYGNYRGHNRGRGSYGSYRGYMPQNTRGQMQGYGNMPPMPGGPGMVIPPEMLAELQKKLREKFPDANIPFAQDGIMSNMPLHLPVSNMRFKPPMHLVPDSSGYYGESIKKKTKKDEETKEVTEPEQAPQDNEELFNNTSEEERIVSQEELEHFRELETTEKMSPQEKKDYLNQKIREKALELTQHYKDAAAGLRTEDISADKIKQIYKDIFSKMKDSLRELKEKMLSSIQTRIEENIAIVRAEIYHTNNICEQFEKEYLQGHDLTLLEPSERKDKVEIPKAFKIQDLVDLKDKAEIQKKLEEMAPNLRIEKQKNITICHTYFNDLKASMRHRFGDISKFEELDYLSRKDIDEVIEKVMDDFVPIHLFSETRDTLKKGTNPALYSFEWNSNLVNIYQIKERKSECRVVKFPNGFPMFSRIAMTYEGRVFLTGGYFKDLNIYLRTTYEYIEKENKMKRRCNMVFRRSDHSVVYNKGYIYAVGAFIDGKFTCSMERYDVKNDKWETKSPMFTPRSGVGLCVFNSNYIFAFGGRNAKNFHLTTIESYDISKDLWRELNYAKTDIWDEGAYLCQAHQITKDKIFIFGKSAPPTEEEVKSCFVFTPDTGEMEECNHLAQHSAFVNPGICYNDSLYFVGRSFKIHKFNWSGTSMECLVL